MQLTSFLSSCHFNYTLENYFVKVYLKNNKYFVDTIVAGTKIYEPRRKFAIFSEFLLTTQGAL